MLTEKEVFLSSELREKIKKQLAEPLFYEMETVKNVKAVVEWNYNALRLILETLLAL
jgi:hypothetical protein